MARPEIKEYKDYLKEERAKEKRRDKVKKEEGQPFIYRDKIEQAIKQGYY